MYGTKTDYLYFKDEYNTKSINRYIKENKIDKCVVCNSAVSYPIPIQLIEKNTFEHTQLKELRIDTTTNATRDIRHDNINEQEPEQQVLVRRICGVFLGVSLSAGMVMLIWYVSTN